jgi:type II secretory pathway component PulF
MPVFSYTALSQRTGEVMRGAVDAPSRREAESSLRAQDLIPLSVREPGAISLLRRRVPLHAVAASLQQMGQMLMSGGIPLDAVLSSMAAEQDSPRVREVFSRLSRAVVSEGRPLSEAMAAVPEAFPPAVVHRVAAGERDGTLAQSLRESGDYLARMARYRSKVIGALVYPASVLTIALGIVSGLSVTVMPKFAVYFAQAGVPLPPTTRLVLWIGQTLARHAAAAVLLLAAAAAGASRLLARRDVRDAVDRALWNLPGWRRIARHIAWARFAETLSALYGRGVAIVDALQLACDSAGTAVLRDAAPALTRRVALAVPIADALREAGVFSPRLVTSVMWGERTATLGTMLRDAADMYAHDVDVLLESLPQVLQPFLIVVIGGIVAFFVVSLYWPMFSLYNVISSGGIR